MNELVTQTISIISAHVAHNSVPYAELPNLIQAVHDSLVTIATGKKGPVEQPKPEPAVAVKKSVHHSYLVSLEDGKRYQTLRRHLSALGMTPDEYRAKWGLAADYPMTSASYSAKRSEMSKALGLGKKKVVEPVEVPVAVQKPRGKPKVEAKAPEVPTEDVQKPAAIVQEPAEAIQEAA